MKNPAGKSFNSGKILSNKEIYESFFYLSANILPIKPNFWCVLSTFRMEDCVARTKVIQAITGNRSKRLKEKEDPGEE